MTNGTLTCILCRGVSEVAEPGLRRGICDSCAIYPSHRGKRSNAVEDYQFIATHEGGSLKEIAARLGVTRDALYLALKRAGIKHVEAYY